MLRRKELKAKGKIAFLRNYWPSVIAGILVMFATTTEMFKIETKVTYVGDVAHFSEYLKIFGIPFYNINIFNVLAGVMIALLVTMLVANVIEVGGCAFFSQNSHENAEFKEMFMGFDKQHYKNIVYIQFVRTLKIFVWSLLLIIPGIIKHYEYYMVPYILADNPTINEKQAFALSKKMMYGHKWEVFVFQLSFILWEILSVFTFGILAYFYVNPYVLASNAEVYHELKNMINNENMNESSQSIHTENV